MRFRIYFMTTIRKLCWNIRLTRITGSGMCKHHRCLVCCWLPGNNLSESTYILIRYVVAAAYRCFFQTGALTWKNIIIFVNWQVDDLSFIYRKKLWKDWSNIIWDRLRRNCFSKDNVKNAVVYMWYLIYRILSVSSPRKSFQIFTRNTSAVYITLRWSSSLIC